jgi:hypothetical protein
MDGSRSFDLDVLSASMIIKLPGIETMVPGAWVPINYYYRRILLRSIYHMNLDGR